MKASIFLKGRDKSTLLANVDLEVCPRGFYEIDGVVYQCTGQPKFIIGGEDRDGNHSLQRVELLVEKYDDSDLL